MNLDDLRGMEKIDSKQMLRSIQEFPDQIETAWGELGHTILPTHYIQVRNIIILGMGGSALAGELAADLARKSSKIPIEVYRDYGCPEYVNKDTLVIAISYSGNTEETVDGFVKASRRGAKLLAISSGGELGILTRKFQVPLLSIDYGAEGRAAFGYLFIAAVVVLQKLRLLDLDPNEYAETAVLLRAFSQRLAPETRLGQNLAKDLAQKLRDRVPLLIGSGTMATIARRWKTQINENGRLAAFAEPMPELCHNMIVGMDRSSKQRDQFLAIFLDSQSSHARNVLRTAIVSRLLTDNHVPIEHVSVQPAGTAFSEALLMTILGDYLSFYLAMQAGTDPSIGPSIIKLKKELAAQAWEPGKY